MTEELITAIKLLTFRVEKVEAALDNGIRENNIKMTEQIKTLFNEIDEVKTLIRDQKSDIKVSKDHNMAQVKNWLSIMALLTSMGALIYTVLGS